MAVITISRDLASGGRKLGRLLSKKLKYEFVQKSLFQKIAEDLDVSERTLESFEKSREYQSRVSEALSKQVLDSLYDLVRGFQAADEKTQGELLREVLAANPNDVYSGLLTTLLRLVFLLYAEDRGLMPNTKLYNEYYSVHI